MGFETAYEKYKPFLKKDETKQRGLDMFMVGGIAQKEVIIEKKTIQEDIKEFKVDNINIDSKWRN